MRRSCCLIAAWGILCCVAVAQVRTNPLFQLEGETDDPVLSSDGKTLVFGWCRPDYSCGLYQRAFSGGEIRALVDSEKAIPGEPRWSPDGTKFAFRRFYSHFDNRLFVRNSDGSSERDLGEICDTALPSAWSPDGRYIAQAVYKSDPSRDGACRLALISVETGKPVRSFTLPGSGAVFSPDGKQLAFADGGFLKRVSLSAVHLPIAPTVVIAREPREISSLVWTPNGKSIVYEVWGDVPYLRRITLGPGAKPQPIGDLDHRFSITQLLPNGTALATETTQEVALWRADLRTIPIQPAKVEDPGCGNGAPGCSPDGRRQAYISARTGLFQIFVADASGSSEHVLVATIPGFANPSDQGSPSLIGWSPNGKWIAFSVFPRHGNADVRTDLYVVPSTGGAARRLAKEAFAVDNASWSGDGRSLYASRGWPIDGSPRPESAIVRIDVASGKLTPLGPEGMWPHESADGKYVYFWGARRNRQTFYRVSTSGGAPEIVADQTGLQWYATAYGTRYIYLFRESTKGDRSTVLQLDPQTKQSIPLGEVFFAQGSPKFRSRNISFISNKKATRNGVQC